MTLVHLSDKICVYISPYEQKKVYINLFAILWCGLSRIFTKRRFVTFFAICEKNVHSTCAIGKFSLISLHLVDEQILTLRYSATSKTSLDHKEAMI